MEDVGSVLVHIDSLSVLAVDVSAEMRTLVNDETAFPRLVGEICESRAEKPRADDDIVVFFIVFSPINRF